MNNRIKTKCKNCKKEEGQHHSKNKACPVGPKTRIGYTTFSKTTVFEAK